MTKELIERLRDSAARHDKEADRLCNAAADAIESLQAENERLKAEYGNACKLVADMHAAAIGQAVGPIRGVVDDVTDVRFERDALAAKLVPLTDKQIQRVYVEFMLYQDGVTPSGIKRIAKAIEAAHGIDAAKGGQHEDA